MFDPSRGDVERVMRRRFEDIEASNAVYRRQVAEGSIRLIAKDYAIRNAFYRDARECGLSPDEAFDYVATALAGGNDRITVPAYDEE